MKLLTFLVIIILSAVSQITYAQSSDEYFYPGATLFVQNNLAEAKLKVESGLQIFPSDPKLIELYKRILENQQEENPQQSQQNNQNQDQDNKDQDQQNQDQQQEEQQKQDQQKQEQQQSQEQKEQELTKQEAESILEAMKENEKDLQKQLRKIKGQRIKTEKDW